MILRFVFIASTVLISGAAELSEKWTRRLENADSNYEQAVQKAENVRFYALQKATQDRVKVLKTALSDATKAGDFDAATEIKSRLSAAETVGARRPKPKNVTKIGGHEYALIEDKASWHVAKRICQEMGGHLAILDSAAETNSLRELCRSSGQSAWIGAINEEGTWLWVDGTAVNSTDGWIVNDARSQAAGMTFWHSDLNLDDFGVGGKLAYICEWD